MLPWSYQALSKLGMSRHRESSTIWLLEPTPARYSGAFVLASPRLAARSRSCNRGETNHSAKRPTLLICANDNTGGFRACYLQLMSGLTIIMPISRMSEYPGLSVMRAVVLSQSVALSRRSSSRHRLRQLPTIPFIWNCHYIWNCE